MAAFPTVVGHRAWPPRCSTAAAPWLSRRWRRLGWLLLAGLVVTRFLDVARLARVAHGGARRLGRRRGRAGRAGAPVRRPTREAIMAGLAAVGAPAVRAASRPSVDARGSTPYFGVDADGDAALRQGARRRRAQRRPAVPPLPRAAAPRPRRRAAVLVAAPRGRARGTASPSPPRDLGVRTPALRAFATAEPNGYVLAYEAIEGRSLDRVDPGELTDERPRGDLDAAGPAAPPPHRPP